MLFQELFTERFFEESKIVNVVCNRSLKLPPNLYPNKSVVVGLNMMKVHNDEQRHNSCGTCDVLCSFGDVSIINVCVRFL